MTITGPDADLLSAVGALRDHVAAPRFALAAEGAQDVRALRTELLNRIDDYLIPRLREPGGPLHLVIGGSTGVGKSTLVNSLVRYDLTSAGVLRPTTRGAVLCVNPADVAATTGPHRLLPAFARTGGDRPRGAGSGEGEARPSGRGEGFTLAPHPAIPYGLALIDAPDVNSVAQGNRETGRRLLGAADSWLLVTTAERYADAVPWDLLHEAWHRRMSVAVVLNRVPAEAALEINQAFAEMLESQLPQAGAEIAVFTVPETTLTAGLIPEYLLDQLATWLRAVSQDPAARLAAVRRTVLGLLDDLPQQIAVLYEALTAQAEAANRLRVQADLAYSSERAAVHDAVAAGELIGGAALVEWQSMIGPGRVETLLDPAAAGGPTARRLLLAAIADQVSAAVSRAAEQVMQAWRGTVPVEEEDPLGVTAGNRAGAVAPELEEWANRLGELVARTRLQSEGAQAEPDFRIAVLIATVLCGRELPRQRRRRKAEPPTPAVAATRRLADQVFPGGLAERLAEQGAAALDAALGALFDRYAYRHQRVLAELGVDPDAAKNLLEAGYAVQRAR
ncbi:MAG TPA: hypothetical protein VH372_21010 [Actinospica sp.]|nr:hypothetical protein [Actinospica sp.]